MRKSAVDFDTRCWSLTLQLAHRQIFGNALLDDVPFLLSCPSPILTSFLWASLTSSPFSQAVDPRPKENAKDKNHKEKASRTHALESAAFATGNESTSLPSIEVALSDLVVSTSSRRSPLSKGAQGLPALTEKKPRRALRHVSGEADGTHQLAHQSMMDRDQAKAGSREKQKEARADVGPPSEGSSSTSCAVWCATEVGLWPGPAFLLL